MRIFALYFLTLIALWGNEEDIKCFAKIEIDWAQTIITNCCTLSFCHYCHKHLDLCHFL